MSVDECGWGGLSKGGGWMQRVGGSHCFVPCYIRITYTPVIVVHSVIVDECGWGWTKVEEGGGGRGRQEGCVASWERAA